MNQLPYLNPLIHESILNLFLDIKTQKPNKKEKGGKENGPSLLALLYLRE